MYIYFLRTLIIIIILASSIIGHSALVFQHFILCFLTEALTGVAFDSKTANIIENLIKRNLVLGRHPHLSGMVTDKSGVFLFSRRMIPDFCNGG